LQQGTALLCPVGLEFENDLLKSQHKTNANRRWRKGAGQDACKPLILRAEIPFAVLSS
jgi:hypothetical protein